MARKVKRKNKRNLILDAVGGVIGIISLFKFAIEITAKRCPLCKQKLTIVNNYYCNECMVYVK